MNISGISPRLTFFDYTFKNVDLLRAVFLHPSLGSIRSKMKEKNAISFDRLEFLGDRILGLVVAQMLFEKYPELDEGGLSLRSSSLVRMESLYRVCVESGLSLHIQHELPPHEKTGKNLLADAMEAFLAALYLDGGLDVVTKFIHLYFEPLLEDAGRDMKPAKTYLQELAHQKNLGGRRPLYTILSQEGLQHLPTFHIEASIQGTEYRASAFGSSIKEAENLAATALLEIIKDIK